MDNIGEEYNNDWERTMFLPSEEVDSYYYPSNWTDGAQLSKNIVSERNRRKKLNERLLALRAVVPNISKMDKLSIIKDAIEYIQELHEQERRIRAEISELESGMSNKNSTHLEFDQVDSKPKRSRRFEQLYGSDSSGSTTPSSFPVDVLQWRVCSMKEKIIGVSLTCSKRRDTMIKVCEVFESLNIKIISANITTSPGRLLKTAFIEGDEEERDVLKLRIETAIASLNDPHSPMNS